MPGDVASHIRLYRSMLEREVSYPGQGMILARCPYFIFSDHVKLFFDCEAETEKTICRESICVSREQEQGNLFGLIFPV